jgi:hypothetical protein
MGRAAVAGAEVLRDHPTVLWSAWGGPERSSQSPIRHEDLLVVLDIDRLDLLIETAHPIAFACAHRCDRSMMELERSLVCTRVAITRHRHQHRLGRLFVGLSPFLLLSKTLVFLGLGTSIGRRDVMYQLDRRDRQLASGAQHGDHGNSQDLSITRVRMRRRCVLVPAEHAALERATVAIEVHRHLAVGALDRDLDTRDRSALERAAVTIGIGRCFAIGALDHDRRADDRLALERATIAIGIGWGLAVGALDGDRRAHDVVALELAAIAIGIGGHLTSRTIGIDLDTGDGLVTGDVGAGFAGRVETANDQQGKREQTKQG